MTQVNVRRATLEDVPDVAQLLSAMLEDMENAGGHRVASAADRRAFYTTAIREQLGQDEFRYVVAESSPPDEPRLVGAANARVVELPAVFTPQRALHISTVYVAPEHRRHGVGHRLLEALLAWGRERSCDHADLNVLTGNPARELYARLGFAVAQHNMKLRL